MQRLKVLLQEKVALEVHHANAKTPQVKANFALRIKQIIFRLKQFGQRYSAVQVTVQYSLGSNKILVQTIYYTAISEEDAIDYTKMLIAAIGDKDYRILHITTIQLPVGRLLTISESQ